MDTATTHKHLQFRGKPVAMVASGHTLAFVTIHQEGKPTPLYRLDLDSGTLSSAPLPCSSACAVTDGENVFIGGSDAQLYRAPLLTGDPAPFGKALPSAPTALACLGTDKIAAGAGTQLTILAASNGKVLQSFDFAEPITALGADATGCWLVVGTGKGTVLVLDAEEKKEFVIAEQKKLHESAVACVLFDPEELRVYTAGVDQKLLLTHVRGELEPEDRGAGAAHDGPVLSMILGPEDKLYSAGQDGTLRTWLRGVHRKRPSTLKEAGRALSMTRVEYKGRPHLALACDDSKLRLYPLDAAGKVGERALTVHDAYVWARQEFAQNELNRRDKAIATAATYDDQGGIDLLTDRANLDPDHGLKVKAASLLGSSNNPRAIQPLESLIKAPEERVRVAALAGLRALLGEKSLRPLESALSAKQRDVGVLAVQALEKLAPSDDEAMSRLVRALDDDPEDVRTTALSSLEAVHPKDSPEASRIALRSKRPDIRRLALVRLFQRKLLELPETRVALRRHEDDGDPAVRQMAFLVSLMTQPTLVEALRGRDRDLHRLLWELETFGQKVEAETKPPKTKKGKVELGTVELRPLLEALASRSLDTCLAGARGLASLQDERAFGTLLQLTNEKDAGARVEACKAMAELGDPRGMPRLRQMFRDPAREVRDAAVTALFRLEEQTPLRAAEAGLMAPYEDVRLRGLQLLVRTMKKTGKDKLQKQEEETALRLLKKSLNDSSESVRGEAFKAVLSQGVAGGGAETLRFALGSIHQDVRHEVLNEVTGRIQESWAPALLLELFQDPEPAIRTNAFAFAQKRSKGKTKEPLQAALAGKYEDLKLEAVAALSKRHVAGVRELLLEALDDDHEKVRLAAVEGLAIDEAQDELRKALQSKHEDVKVRAAVARAAHGDEASLEPLLALATALEPELKEQKGPWRDRVVRALGGLAELGDPKAGNTVATLVTHDDLAVRRAAVTALGWVCGDDEALQQRLASCLSDADASVKLEAATGMAVVGNPAGLPLLGDLVKKQGEEAMRGLHASLALGESAEDLFLSYLDHDDRTIRGRALLLMMMVESSEQDGEPDRCLAALSSRHPRTRMLAARALESFADAEKFANWVTELFNDRGDEHAPWKFPHEAVRALAEVVTHAGPGMRIRAARLLAALDEEKPEHLERAWRGFSTRFADVLSNLTAAAKERKVVEVQYSPDEMKRVVLGAYAGLSRQAGTNQDARVRQTALSRLWEMARGDSDLIPTVQPLLSMALSDRDVAVRKVAFDSLGALGMAPADLAAEAISVGVRDMGVAGLRLLADSTSGKGKGKDKDGTAVLSQVYLTNTDGLEVEAGVLLAESKGQVETSALGLSAKSAQVRDGAIRGLALAYDKDDQAKAALRKALESPFEHVRDGAALELGRKKDSAAFDALVAMLKTRRQNEAIDALEQLGDGRTPDALLDRIDHNPAGDANVARLMEAAGNFRLPAVTERLLGYVEDTKTRRFAFDALRVVSGHDQPIRDGDDRDPVLVVLQRSAMTPPALDWEQKQHARHDAVLAKTMEAAARLGDAGVLQKLFPAAQWARGSEVDAVLASLCTSTTDAVRDRAVTALGFRLRKRGAKPEPLVTALGHGALRTQLLAAEALAWAGRAEGVRVLMTAVDMMENLDDRRRAVRALGELADPTALDILLRLVNEEGHALQEDAAEAIGHLSTTDKAEAIEKLLLRLARGEGGVALRAMSGLRWFGSEEGWKLLRERARDPNVHVRHQAVELLAHAKDAAARDALVYCIESDDAFHVAKKAVESLRAVDGADSLEPDYVLLRSQWENLEPTLLERLQERGDATRIMMEFPKIQQEEEYFDPLVALLLARDPLPVDAAASQLDSAHEKTGTVAAAILGRAGKAAAKKHGKALASAVQKSAESWDKKRKELLAARENPWELEAFTQRYAKMLWACGQLQVADDAVIAAAKLEGGETWTREIRTAAMLVLAAGGGGKAGTEVLRAALKDMDARIRSLAASGIAKTAPKTTGEVVADVIDDRASLDRLLAVEGKDTKTDKVLRDASRSAHTQGVVLPHLVARGDVKGLTDFLGDKDLSEVTRLGALEALARIASEEAQKALAAFAKRKEEDEELRKAAWRGLRRARRYAAAGSREVTS
jgi:ParB family chromosome partitioning protein